MCNSQEGADEKNVPCQHNVCLLKMPEKITGRMDCERKRWKKQFVFSLRAEELYMFQCEGLGLASRPGMFDTVVDLNVSFEPCDCPRRRVSHVDVVIPVDYLA